MSDGAVEFRVWAPAAGAVELVVDDGPARRLALRREDSAGLWSLRTDEVGAGSRYRYSLDGADPLPDPCSRFQPDGVHGPSQVVDPKFPWSDGGWRGLRREGLVIYELHTGTFSESGTFAGVIERLPYLAALGVGALELMPVADFPGDHNWGYDGVALYAPSRAYGGPAGLQRLVDAAHAHGLGVILDCVYNHLGPDGNYLRSFSPSYFTDRYSTPWGEAINYDGEGSRLVREYVLQNAEHWLRDYHIDGLRLDATSEIHDSSTPHLLTELAQRCRAATPRSIVLIAESDANDVRLAQTPDTGGNGLDAVWADDFHHAVHVTLTGEHEGYYQDYRGGAAEIGRAIRDGFLYQGQRSPHLARPRGGPVGDAPADAFVFCLQNHDQVGNRALGERLSALVTPALYRAVTALLLFAPETPLLFMGQEFAASSPFLFFTSFDAELGRLVTEGRRAEFHGFSAFRDEATRDRIPDPQALETFSRSRLDWLESERHAGILRLHRALLRLRRDDPVLRLQDRQAVQVVTSHETLLVARSAGDAARLLLVNLRADGAVDAASMLPDSLAGRQLRVLLSTGDRAFLMPGESAPGMDIERGNGLQVASGSAALFAVE